MSNIYFVTLIADYRYISDGYVSREKSNINMKITNYHNVFSLEYISSDDTFDEMTFQDNNFAPKSPPEYKEIAEEYIRDLDVTCLTMCNNSDNYMLPVREMRVSIR